MSDTGLIKHQIADLEAIRKEHLAQASAQRANAQRFRAQRDRPSNPSRAYEHQRECDQKAADAERDADSNTRSAERVLNEIRGLEARLR
ncbi:hypothetical protein [Microbacterium sp. 1P10AE]|jgi:hypothetical protein|uniref:hypothetical protein n=1 Tax=Microbacterium sp. 1P10AE TaxID=3132286 RepID=UPI0039A3D083